MKLLVGHLRYATGHSWGQKPKWPPNITYRAIVCIEMLESNTKYNI